MYVHKGFYKSENNYILYQQEIDYNTVFGDNFFRYCFENTTSHLLRAAYILTEFTTLRKSKIYLDKKSRVKCILKFCQIGFVINFTTFSNEQCEKTNDHQLFNIPISLLTD